MTSRDDFTKKTIRILAERAGQCCSNPDCNQNTSGPSDDGSSESTRLGKAAHITAAAKGGPRYDKTLSQEQRSSPENGIWLCAECADKIDKRENEAKYPAELLKYWKEFCESATGTDFASIENKRSYPVRKLTLTDFTGVQDEVTINFGSLTIFRGTSKLNKSICEILDIFSDRKEFEVTRQLPHSFAQIGKIKLYLSNGEEFIIIAEKDKTSIYKGDAIIPIFSPMINVVSIRNNFYHAIFDSYFSDMGSNILERLSSFFRISTGELKDCIKGVPTDYSLFGYNYEVRNDSELYLKFKNNNDFKPLGVLSSGEQNRFVLDMAIKIAKHTAKLKSTVLAIDKSHIYSLDKGGWKVFLEWADKNKLPFQVVVDNINETLEGDLSHAMCYEAIGTDMAVYSFKLLTWNKFREMN